MSHPPPPIKVTVCSVDEAKQAVARYGACSSTVEVELPSLVRLRHARLVYKELRRMQKDRNWKLEYGAIMLKQGRSLDETLHQLWCYVGDTHVVLSTAARYHARLMGMLEEDDDADLPSLGVEEGDPVAATAALLSRVDGIVDDPAASSAAVLRGIYGIYNQSGSSRAAALCQVLTAMEERFSVIPGLAMWTTNLKPCEDLALSGHKIIAALGVLSSAPDPPGGPDTSESVAARLSRLEELKTVVWLFHEAIESVMFGPVSFNFRPFESVTFPSYGVKCPYNYIEWSSEDDKDTDGAPAAPAGVNLAVFRDSVPAPADVGIQIIRADERCKCDFPDSVAMSDGLPWPRLDGLILDDGLPLPLFDDQDTDYFGDEEDSATPANDDAD